MVGTTADFRRFRPPRPLRVNHLLRKDSAAAGRIGEVRLIHTNGFVVLPRRWVVERIFSWFGRNRRLAKDFENLAETLAAFVALACIQIAVRRLARA